MSTQTVETIATDALRATGRMSVDIAELRRIMPVVKAIAGGRVSVPCLSWVRFNAGKLSAFDFETSITARVSEDGTLYGAVSFEDLARAVAILPKKGAVEFVASADGNTVHLGALAVPAQDSTDLPDLPDVTERLPLVDLSPAHMAELARVMLAASKDDTLPVLTTVQYSPGTTAGAFALAATDRYRLHYAELWASVTRDAAHTMSAKTLAMVAKLAKGVGVRIDTVGDLTVYTFGSITMTDRQGYGEFPRWRQLVPAEMSESVTLNRAEMIEAVRKAGAVLRRTAPVRIEYTTTGADVVAVDGAEVLRLSVSGANGTAGTVYAVNPSFLLDALAALTGDTVTIESTDAAKRPAVYVGSGDSVTRALVMPVRLSQ